MTAISIRIINRETNVLKRVYHSQDQNDLAKLALSTSIWFLGRRMHKYIVIKSDDKGDRILDWSTQDGVITNIEKALIEL